MVARRWNAEARSARPSLRPAMMVVLLAALLLVGESLLPGRLFLPLQPDDFPDWSAGVETRQLQPHPHPDWCMSDVLHLLVPGLAVTQRAAQRGELPLWDDSQALGVPHLDEVHYAVLYPPAWLPLALGYPGLAWMALLHLLLAGLGMLLYLVALGRTRTAALLGALAFLGSAWLTARLHSFPVAGASVWLPWVLWGLERAAQAAQPGTAPPGARAPASPARRYVAAAALALAFSFLAGFPQVTLLIAATAAFFELLRVIAALRGRQPWLATAGRAAAALALGVALAAPQLLPTLDYLRHDGLRGEQSAEVAAADALDPALLWNLLVPDRYATGALTGANPLALQDVPAARNPVSVNRAEVSMGIGVLGLLLALLAAAFGRGWRTVACTLLAAGVLTLLFVPPALRVAAEALPLLRVGSPRRLLLLSTFALSVLAAGGLDLLRARRLGVTVTAWLLSIALLTAAVVARLSVPSAALDQDVQEWAARLALDLDQPNLTVQGLLQLVPPDNFRVASERAATGAMVALVVAAAAVLVFRPLRERAGAGWTTLARRSPAILTCVLAAELIFTGAPLLRAARTAEVTDRPAELSALAEPPLVQAVRATGPEGPAPLRLWRLGNDPPWLRPNFAGLYGLSDVSCYAPMAPRLVSELLEQVEPGVTLSGSALGGMRHAETLAAPVLDLLGVRAVLTSQQDVPPPDGWHKAAELGSVSVLANDDALPPAFVVHAAELQPDAAARLARLAAPDFPVGSTVLLEQPPPPGSLPPRPPPGARAAEVSAWQPGDITVHVSQGPSGLLVVPVGWHAGWTARAGGHTVPVLRADHALLAVPLPGREDVDVQLHFETPRLRAGFAVGAMAWLLALALLVGPRRRATVAVAEAGPA
ncbi:MAG TPA: hypothetical protein VFY71_12775 [Planctomycetota bacterium]|nr:hypothetical protein [Planctomycetota bacterium]